MNRAAAAEKYRALPLPTTSDEHWRFTDLAGFDADAFVSNGRVRGQAPDVSMLDIETAGVADVSESGIELVRVPDGITFEPLGEHARLGELVRSEERRVGKEGRCRR